MIRHTQVSTRARTRALPLAAALAAGTLAVSTMLAPAPAAQAAGPHRHTETFTSTTGTPWLVPGGVTNIRVSVAGARGGTTMTSGGGGSGDLVTFDLPVTPGDRFTFYGATDTDDRN